MSRRIVLVAACTLFGGCASAVSMVSAARAPQILRWKTFEHVTTPIDVALGRPDGLPVVAANGKLFLLRRSGRLTPFAPVYTSNPTNEAYIAVWSAHQRGCSFGAGSIYAIRLANGRGVSRITAGGRVRQFAKINAPGLINGIAFDDVGRFHYRLLVTIANGSTATVDAINCRGAVQTITSTMPRVEGGIAVAPRSFGRFAGDLIAPDELSGRIFAITPRGKSTLLADSGLPHGGDFGVESEIFVPSDPRATFLVADRLTPGNPHPGDDVLLRIRLAALRAEGVRPGDLLVTTEGGAFTDAVRCGAKRCSVRFVAKGPSGAHIEGHIAVIVPSAG